VTLVGVERFQDKTRWTKALGEAVPVVYGDCNEDIGLSKHSSTVRLRRPGHFESTIGRDRVGKHNGERVKRVR
jgi:hypothetical protein